MLNNKNFLELVFIFTLLLTGCKKSGGIIEVKPVKDPRTYTWTADTLGYPGSYQTLMDDIWGSSPTDVYTVGHNSSGGNGVMWHYDGSKWTNSHLLATEGGQISGAIELTSVYGFSSTDIYAAGKRIVINPTPPPDDADSSLIIHYDGSSWKKVNIIASSFLTDIQGSSSNNIWAGGNSNTLYHYDGSSWTKDSVAISVPVNEAFNVTSTNTGNSGTYMTGYTSFPDLSDLKAYLLKRVNSSWIKIDSTGFYTYRLHRSPAGELYYTGEGGVYEYDGTQLVSIFSVNQYIAGISASSDENIFAVGQGGINKVYHYNGTDWKEIEQLSLPQADYWAVWTDGTEAFVVGHINDGGFQKTIVWHGK